MVDSTVTLISGLVGSGGLIGFITVYFKSRYEAEKQRQEHEIKLLQMRNEEQERMLTIVRESQNGKMTQLVEMMSKITEIQTNLVVMQRDIQTSVGRIAATLEARPWLMGVDKREPV